MKIPLQFVVMVSAAFAIFGCGSSDKGSSDNQNAVLHPKYPDLWVTFSAEDSESGNSFWQELDDGYEPYPTSWVEELSLSDTTQVKCVPVYTGTTDSGDTFELEVIVGDESQEAMKVVYEGKRLEIVLTDGVKVVFEPDPLADFG